MPRLSSHSFQCSLDVISAMTKKVFFKPTLAELCDTGFAKRDLRSFQHRWRNISLMYKLSSFTASSPALWTASTLPLMLAGTTRVHWHIYNCCGSFFVLGSLKLSGFRDMEQSLHNSRPKWKHERCFSCSLTLAGFCPAVVCLKGKVHP